MNADPIPGTVIFDGAEAMTGHLTEALARASSAAHAARGAGGGDRSDRGRAADLPVGPSRIVREANAAHGLLTSAAFDASG